MDAWVHCPTLQRGAGWRGGLPPPGGPGHPPVPSASAGAAKPGWGSGTGVPARSTGHPAAQLARRVGAQSRKPPALPGSSQPARFPASQCRGTADYEDRSGIPDGRKGETAPNPNNPSLGDPLLIQPSVPRSPLPLPTATQSRAAAPPSPSRSPDAPTPGPPPPLGVAGEGGPSASAALCPASPDPLPLHHHRRCPPPPRYSTPHPAPPVPEPYPEQAGEAQPGHAAPRPRRTARSRPARSARPARPRPPPTPGPKPPPPPAPI